MNSRKAFLTTLAAGTIMFAAFTHPVSAQDSTSPASPPPESTRYQCVALEEAGGQQEPSLTSPPTRMPDGRIRILKKDEVAYGSWATEEPPEWIALYGARDGEATSFFGHFPSKYFKCQTAPA